MDPLKIGTSIIYSKLPANKTKHNIDGFWIVEYPQVFWKVNTCQAARRVSEVYRRLLAA